MADANPDLIARLIELRRPGESATAEDRRRYATLSRGDLARMVETLEGTAETARQMRTALDNDGKRRENLRNRQERALARFDSLAIRIAERATPPVLAQAQQVVIRRATAVARQSEPDPELTPILQLFEDSGGDLSVEWSLRLGSVLDEYGEEWRKSVADRFAELIVRDGPGNLITLIEAKTGGYQIDELLKAEVVEKYLEFALQKTSWGVVRLMDRKLMATVGRDKALKRFLSLRTLRNSVFEPAFLTDFSPLLTATSATETLAKMYLFGSEFRATRIISAGGGGEMLGHFLVSEMRLGGEKSQHWNLRSTALREAMRSVQADDRVLVVTDIASSARDLLRLREALEETVPGTAIAFAALAGRAEAYEQLRAGPLVYFGHLTAERDARLPWQGGGYHRTRASHFFGHSGRSPLRIAKDFFATVTTGLRSLVG